MKNITLLVLFCLLFGNCTNNKELKKKEITISYLSIKKLNSDSWIKIDNHKFNHVKKYTISDINSNRKELPSKKIILTIIKDKELKENVSQIMLLKYYIQN